ncbi:hypothetical protein, partial [Neisseria sicca]|uniref:hypothetical protein n=1 Tax=Neisseria sicca TaxID=490 RepID=UPI001C9995F5
MAGGLGKGVWVDKGVELGFEGGLDVGVVLGGVLGGDLEDEGVEDIVVLGDEGRGGENMEGVGGEDGRKWGEEGGGVGDGEDELE